jgi:hypothetical protein
MRLFGLNILTDKQIAALEIEKELTEQLKIASAWHHAEHMEKQNHYDGISASAQADFLYRKQWGDE